MRFQCEGCQTRYTIADDMVRGKVLKVRCRTCGVAITVRETGSAASAKPVSDTVRERPKTVDSAPILPVEDWYLAVGPNQEGPFNRADAIARVKRKAPGDEMYAWREDFEAWKLVERVPELAAPVAPGVPEAAAVIPASPPEPVESLLVSAAPAEVAREPAAAPRAPSPAVAATSPTVPAVDPPAKAVPVHDIMDFEVGEASGLKRLHPPAAGAPGGIMDFEVGEPSGLKQLSALQAPKARSAEASRRPPPPGLVPSVTAGRRPARKRGVAGFILAGVSAAIIAGGIIVVVTHGNASDSPQITQGDTPPPALVANFYDKPGQLPAKEALAPDAEPIVVEIAKPTPPHTHVARPAPVIDDRTPRISPAPGAKVDSFDDGTASKPLTPDDVRDAYAANEVGLKRCYERALKEDPTITLSKMDVTITIGPAGVVRSVNVPSPGPLGNCVTGAIRLWRFRRSPGELTTEFTVYFAKRG